MMAKHDSRPAQTFSRYCFRVLYLRTVWGIHPTGTKIQAPTSNIQRSSKIQVPGKSCFAGAHALWTAVGADRVWILGFGASLDVECWRLESSIGLTFSTDERILPTGRAICGPDCLTSHL